MPLAAVSATSSSSPQACEAPAAVRAAYRAHQGRTGRGNSAYATAARSFLRRWPDVRRWEAAPLDLQLRADGATRPFIMFLLVTGRLHPGWDYLVHRKFSAIWRDLPGTVIGEELEEFIAAARTAGYSPRVASAMASQVMARLLFATGKRLVQITDADFDALAAAGLARQADTGRTWKHYRATATATRTVLFHMGVLPALPAPTQQRWPFTRRVEGVPEPMHSILVRYLQAKSATCKPVTVSGIATRLAHFGRVIAAIDPQATPATMNRAGHIEPWLAALPGTGNTKTGGCLSRAEQARRILAVANFLSDITEWDWPEAPNRRLLFSSDNPRLPQPLPRFLPPDADRRLTEALQASPYRLAADALLLQRACGLRIGELLDLELDAVIDIPASGSWLKVPLGKLDTERMVPIDDEIVFLIDRITATRSPGRPIPHPRTGRPAHFLFDPSQPRRDRPRPPHQLRHTYATALVNAGVSLQALMAILGHVSAEMSLRYAHLFDTTVRAEYERALDLAKTRIGTLPTPSPATTGHPQDLLDWKATPTIKTALAGGYCQRAPAQGACTYANICEYCPSFHTDTEHTAALTMQRDATEVLTEDATARGWDTETERHLRLITQLNHLIDTTATRPEAT